MVEDTTKATYIKPNIIRLVMLFMDYKSSSKSKYKVLEFVLP